MGAKDGDENENASPMLLKCIDNSRIDVLCSILAQLKQKPNFQETLDAICCAEGTLLHRAVQLDSVDATCALLVNGSNACVQNNEGKTPFNCCKSDGVRNAFVQEALRAITMGKWIGSSRRLRRVGGGAKPGRRRNRRNWIDGDGRLATPSGCRFSPDRLSVAEPIGAIVVLD
ncbi:hypothetical protein WR25_17064 [Diploscapter pachys]|uniref:Uncharacterized protein n=1 Tax=Diploscapter pachys TaxID=2018661 RepID=A0A2A2L418_9BILA|nr:hypothetical protein WR25_17064 [Diploscapter pachys]